MKKVIDFEWEEADPSDLVLADTCACGEIAFYTHWKDADFIGAIYCSDACRSIADTRKSWSEIYG